MGTHGLFAELGRHDKGSGSQECPNCGACQESIEHVLFECVSYDSATEVMSTQDYLNKVMSHLQNEEYYLNLDEELASHYAEEITCLLREITDRQVIDKQTFKYLWLQDPRTSRFYTLP